MDTIVVILRDCNLQLEVLWVVTRTVNCEQSASLKFGEEVWKESRVQSIHQSLRRSHLLALLTSIVFDLA